MSATKLAEALPPLPGHPEPRTMKWSELELRAIREYGMQCAREALASYEAEPAVQVVVERERVWVKRGVQSFMLAYEAETDVEREWYAGQLRAALSSFTPDVKAAPAAPAPLTDAELDAVWARDCDTGGRRANFRRGYRYAVQQLTAAPAAPAPTVKDSLTPAPAGPVIKVLVRGSNAPLHVTGRYGDTVFVDLPEAAPAAPAPEPLTDADLLDLTPERDFGLTPEIEAYIVASMRAAIAASKGGA
jgi:hypothetical protein